MLNIKDIQAAAEKTKDFVHKTPLIYSNSFSKMTGAEVYLKAENLQKTGSFKVRGAFKVTPSYLSDGCKKACKLAFGLLEEDRSSLDATMVSSGEDIEKACEKGINIFAPGIKVGIIAISKEGFTVASNTEMANYVLVKEI